MARRLSSGDRVVVRSGRYAATPLLAREHAEGPRASLHAPVIVRAVADGVRVGVDCFLVIARAWAMGGAGELRAHASQPTMQMLRRRLSPGAPSSVAAVDTAPRLVRVLVDDGIADGIVLVEFMPEGDGLRLGPVDAGRPSPLP
jgi:hypothetical protein